MMDIGCLARELEGCMIIVFGSLNVDMVTHVDRLPKSGETVMGQDHQLFAGGKGANQALAARLASGPVSNPASGSSSEPAGANVIMVGAVGQDSHAVFAMKALSEAGVDMACMAHVAAPTGVAFITVDASGANQIVVSSGANAAAMAAQLEGVKAGSSRFLVVQCETNPRETRKALRWAAANKLTTIMNLAPFRMLDADELGLINVLIMNEHEATALATGLEMPLQTPAFFCQQLSQRHDLVAVVTLGARGAVAHAGGRSFAANAHEVAVVDTTAAGDAFCGAFTAALGKGDGIGAALRQGCIAGSLACSVSGAQTSLPDHAAIQRAIRETR